MVMMRRLGPRGGFGSSAVDQNPKHHRYREVSIRGWPSSAAAWRRAQRCATNRPIGARRLRRRPTMHRKTCVGQLIVLSTLLLIGPISVVRPAAAAGSTNSLQLSSQIGGTLPFTVGV